MQTVHAADPLNQRLLTCPKTRQEACDIVDGFLSSLPAQMSLYAVLTALTSTFVGLCDDHDIDPDEAFPQIVDTVFRDPATIGARESICANMRHIYA